MDKAKALEVVNYMTLEKGHTLTTKEAEAIYVVLSEAFKMGSIREALT